MGTKWWGSLRSAHPTFLIGFGRVGLLADDSPAQPAPPGVSPEIDVRGLRDMLDWLCVTLGEPIPSIPDVIAVTTDGFGPLTVDTFRPVTVAPFFESANSVFWPGTYEQRTIITVLPTGTTLSANTVNPA